MVRRFLMEASCRRDERAEQRGHVDQPVCDEVAHFALPLPDAVHGKQ